MTTEPNPTNIDLATLRMALEKPLQLVVHGERRQEFEAYVEASMPHLERAVIDVLGSIVDAMNAAGTDVHCRLEFRDGGIVFSAGSQSDSGPELTFDDADMERITLRLPKALKEAIDQEAARQGISANSWYVRHLGRILARHLRRGPGGHVGRGFTGTQPEGGDAPRRRGNRGRGPHRGRHSGGRE